MIYWIVHESLDWKYVMGTDQVDEGDHRQHWHETDHGQETRGHQLHLFFKINI